MIWFLIIFISFIIILISSHSKVGFPLILVKILNLLLHNLRILLSKQEHFQLKALVSRIFQGLQRGQLNKLQINNTFQKGIVSKYKLVQNILVRTKNQLFDESLKLKLVHLLQQINKDKNKPTEQEKLVNVRISIAKTNKGFIIILIGKTALQVYENEQDVIEQEQYVQNLVGTYFYKG
ncbi:unnamed protein product [Paramecium sonneborni]|uniref:Uncharacterized protein n=1 Tax=Paramecium sonneborni TaxID=65129 RepID=A0A8S1NTR0_9CILI|nr:unnamed protein product [Paramecium sonneborni]